MALCIPIVTDLPAAYAVYHKQCSVNFNTGKRMPQTVACGQSDDPSAAKCLRLSGRPKDELRSEVFLQVTSYLEQNDEEHIKSLTLSIICVQSLLKKTVSHTASHTSECIWRKDNHSRNK